MSQNKCCLLLRSSDFEADRTIHHNASVRYLDQFKQIKLPDGEKSDPVHMELDELRIKRYRQFFKEPSEQANEDVDNKAFVLKFSELLTVLVGPNNSGKSSLLNALELFCKVVKHGSGDYDLKAARQLFGINNDMSKIILEGTFTVHYQNSTETKQLVLNVVILNGNDAFNTKSKEETIAICVIGQNIEFRGIRSFDIEQFCLSCCRLVSVRSIDYGILENLFPQILSLNSKSEFGKSLDAIFKDNPRIRDCRQEINEEINKIFPSIQLVYREEIYIEHNPSFARFMKENVDLEQQGSPILITGALIPFKNEMINQKLKNANSCSEGVWKCLNLIISVCCAEKKSIITIDEPDAQIFPNAQKLLIDFFCRKLTAYRNSGHFCRMIITTHSTDIMHVVGPENIRQIFQEINSSRPTQIRSLKSVSELLNATTNVGSSFLSYGEFVRFSVHRKLLYLENHDDYIFFQGIIRQNNPELLNLPFTIMSQGGRTDPTKIRKLIREFQQLLPDTTTLHIFILVDADLRWKEMSEKEKKQYDELENDKQLRVRLYFHCWDAREWENWLLINEDLLYEMLYGDHLSETHEIKELRERIGKHWNITSHQNESSVVTCVTTAAMLQLSNNRCRFDQWYKEQLKDHFNILWSKLTSETMEGYYEILPQQESRRQSKALGKEFLLKAGVSHEMIESFDKYDDSLFQYSHSVLYAIGCLVERHSSKENDRKQKNKSCNTGTKKLNDKELDEQRSRWFNERNLQDPIDYDDKGVRRELVKWIDAKLFFYQLIHGKDIKSENTESKIKPNINLDNCWKDAFFMKTQNGHYKYGRYFSSLYTQNQPIWPDDFKKLCETFKLFVTAS